MIVLDTNVISETMRAKPDRRVVQWLDRQNPSNLYLCAPVLAEIFHGIARLDASVRKTPLLDLCREMVAQVFHGRVLPLDAAAAEAYGSIVAQREAHGRPITVIDAMIAAIARSNNAELATRNTRDFTATGLKLINPFEVVT